MKKIKKPAIKKAANGLQKIQATDATTRQLATQGLSMAANAALPGIGGAAVAGINALSSLAKNEDGLYKSKTAQALDSLNPVTQVTRVANGLGKIFKGDFKGLADLDNQKNIKKELALAKSKKEADDYYNTLGQDTTSMSQMSQYKQGAKKVATKLIEIEGGEPHFSKKVNGKRQLKSFDPTGPTHEQGGIAALAESGDAIVTAKKGMGVKAVQAHMAGDHKQVEKLINQMPEDSPNKKKKGGVKKLTAEQEAYKAKQAELNKNGYNLEEDGIWGERSKNALLDFQGFNEPLAYNNKLKVPNTAVPLPKKLGNTSPTIAPAITPKGEATSLLQGASSIYNLGQGLFGKVDKTTRRAFSPELNKYEDTSAPSRRAANAAMKAKMSSARNLSGGAAGNMRANNNQAFADNYNQQAGINTQEAGRKLDINNANTALRNDAKVRNNAMNDQADNLDMQNQAKKSEALSKGLEGIAALSANSVLQKNTLAKEAADRGALGELYKNFTLDVNGRPIYKKRKGAKNIKPTK